jgi:hypothetical protein
VQDHTVGNAAGPAHGAGPQGGDEHGDVLVEGGVEPEHGIAARRSLVADDGLAPPEAPVEADGVLHAGERRPAHVEGVDHGGDAPAQPEGEAATGEAVQRRGPRRRHHRVARGRVGDAGGDADLGGHGGGRPGERCRLLHVEALGDEHRTQSQPFGVGHLVEQDPGVGDVPGEAVASELDEAVGHGRRS